MINRLSMFERVVSQLNRATLATARATDSGVHYARTKGVAQVAGAAFTGAVAASALSQTIARKAFALVLSRTESSAPVSTPTLDLTNELNTLDSSCLPDYVNNLIN